MPAFMDLINVEEKIKMLKYSSVKKLTIPVLGGGYNFSMLHITSILNNVANGHLMVFLEELVELPRMRLLYSL